MDNLYRNCDLCKEKFKVQVLLFMAAENVQISEKSKPTKLTKQLLSSYSE